MINRVLEIYFVSSKRQLSNVKRSAPRFHVLRLAFFVCCCLFVFGCENDVRKVNESNERKPNIEEAIKIESYLSQGGRQRAKLVAPYMKRYMLDTSYLEFPRS